MKKGRWPGCTIRTTFSLPTRPIKPAKMPFFFPFRLFFIFAFCGGLECADVVAKTKATAPAPTVFCTLTIGTFLLVLTVYRAVALSHPNWEDCGCSVNCRAWLLKGICCPYSHKSPCNPNYIDASILPNRYSPSSHHSASS